MHNVPDHQVMRVAIPFDEQSSVRKIIEAANQFVADNYGADDASCYIAISMSGQAIVPVRIDIVGNFLVYMQASNLVTQVSSFLVNLRKELMTIGIRFEDCVGGVSVKGLNLG